MTTKSTKSPEHNWGGHVYFDRETYGFYAECNAKADQISLHRRHGLLQDKFQRNPLMGEKSPRSTKKFDFDVPPAPEEKVKWHEPEIDYGLISLLPSQKKTSSKMLSMEKYYKDKLAAYEAHEQEIKLLQEKEKLSKEKSLDKVQSNSSLSTGKSSNSSYLTLTHENLQHHQNRKPPSNIPSLGLASSSPNLPLTTTNQLNSTNKSIPPPLISHRFSSLRTLKSTNPEVVDSWRNQRAAKFIEKYQHTQSRKAEAVTVDSNSESLTMLMSELEKTEAAIRKHEQILKAKASSKRM